MKANILLLGLVTLVISQNAVAHPGHSHEAADASLTHFFYYLQYFLPAIFGGWILKKLVTRS